MHQFQVGENYTRKEIFSIVGIPDPRGGNWYTGYTSHGNDWFIFCGIGTPGRTGHDYQNHFAGTNLVWHGKVGSRVANNSIQTLLATRGEVYIFYRRTDRSPFTFAGLGKPEKVNDTSPVQIIWSLHPPLSQAPLAEEITTPDGIFEGAKKTITVNVFERNDRARSACLAHYGRFCSVCRFNFGLRYGTIGEGFMHVHHLIPLSDIGEEYELDSIKDLRPVCPNCHAMLHKRRPPFSIQELQDLLRQQAEGVDL